MTTDDDKALPSGAETVLRVRDLARAGGAAFDLRPDSAARADIAGQLGLLGLRKLSFRGDVRPEGKGDWQLTATLGATVVQPCVVTLEPVTTRIDDPVDRRFLAEPPPLPEAGEVEMPEDDSEEALGTEIDLGAVMIEALALALPSYPRKPGAETGEARFAAPGVSPLSDDEMKPFAGLGALRDKLADEDPDASA